MNLSERLSKCLKEAGLSPRNLGGAINIHFVTIYKAINDDGTRQPLHEQVLITTLDKLDALIAAGTLPFKEKLNKKDKTARLKDLLDNHD